MHMVSVSVIGSIGVVVLFLFGYASAVVILISPILKLVSGGCVQGKLVDSWG